MAHDTRQGTLRVLKLPTEPGNQAASLAAGVRRLLGSDEQLDGIVHGTTVITNALLEGRGARVALVTTAGFRDTLEIGRLSRERLYDLERPPKRLPLVPRERRLEVAERVLADGRVHQPLAETEVQRVLAAVGELSAEAVAICLLHAYANPAHEQRLAVALAEVVDAVCASSSINAEYRELERTSTTVLNAAVMPVARRYVEQLRLAMTGLGAGGERLHLVQSSGGMIGLDTAMEQPLRMVMSGPAAGVAAAQALLAEAGTESAVTFDMGGTSTDVCLIAGGVAQTTRERSLDGWKVRLPSVAVESIGAGGGSLAWLDPTGALKVGPRSAGARPGPAAYGLGGQEPTVTDANVALGLIRPELEFGEGAIRIDARLARRALERIAGPLGLGVEAAASGVLEVANAGMLRAIRLVSVQRGIDPRGLTLVAYGGAGPLHASRLAESLGVPRVVVPAYASAFSALGCLASELRYDLVQTYRRPLAAIGGEALETELARLEEAAAEPLRREGYPPEAIALRRSLDLRYSGQNYELEVPISGGRLALDLAAVRADFERQHRRLYSYATAEPLECVALRVVAAVPAGLPSLLERRAAGPALVVSAYPCSMPGHGAVRAAVYRRAGLETERPVPGPALVEDELTTTVVPPGQAARLDRLGNLWIEAAAR